MTKLLFILGLILSIPCLGQKINVGDTAPTFTVKDIYEKEITIPSNSKTLLFFMRYAGCPICNLRMQELIENQSQQKDKGYQLIVVYQSSDSTLREYLKNENLTMTIIGDPNRKLYKKYGVEPSFWITFSSAFKRNTYKNKRDGERLYGSIKPKRDGSLMGIPADFIISENGLILRAYYGQSISDHLPLKEIL